MSLVVFMCRNSFLDYHDTVKKFIEKMMEQSIMTKLLTNARESNSTTLNNDQLTWRRTSSLLRIGPFKNGYQFWQDGGGQWKRFQYCLNPHYPHQFLFFRAIQGRSGSTSINPALQDSVLLPEGLTEYVYHVGSGKELRSIVNYGLIPGGVSLGTDRQAVFFIIVSPMDSQDGSGVTLCDLSHARIAPYKNTWKRLQNTIV